MGGGRAVHRTPPPPRPSPTRAGQAVGSPGDRGGTAGGSSCRGAGGRAFRGGACLGRGERWETRWTLGATGRAEGVLPRTSSKTDPSVRQAKAGRENAKGQGPRREVHP